MLSNKTLIILTTILSVLILTTVFLNSCTISNAEEIRKAEDATYGWNYADDFIKYRILNINGHEYILFKSHVYCGNDIVVIHSESCSCKRKNN